MLVVEHDRDVIPVADHVVDIGPKAGAHGGSMIVFEGPVAGAAVGSDADRAVHEAARCR